MSGRTRGVNAEGLRGRSRRFAVAVAALVAVGAGFVAYCFIKLVRGKADQVAPMMYGAAFAFVVYFLLPLIQRLLPV